MASYDDLVQAARQQITEISVTEMAASRDEFLLIDVRETNEHIDGVLEGAALIPRGLLESDIARFASDPHTRIAVYCGVGGRSEGSARNRFTAG